MYLDYTLRRIELAASRVARRSTRRALTAALRAFRTRRTRIDLSFLKRDISDTIVRVMEGAEIVGLKRAERDIQRQPLRLDALRDILKNLKSKKPKLKGIVHLRREYKKIAKKSGVTSTATLADKISDTVSELIAEGALLKDARTELKKIVAVSDHLLNTLFRTHAQMAVQGAHWATLEDSIALWGYMYSTAGDERVRDTHDKLDGVILPRDHKLWRTIAPPNGWNCRCYLIPLFEPEPIVMPRSGWEVDKGFRTNWGRNFY